MTDTVRDWRKHAPPYLAYGRWHEGTRIKASVDRQWLWRLESTLSLGPQNDDTRSVCRDLKQYLNETCEHEWAESEDYGGPDGEPPRPVRQCRWCYLTEWLAADGSYGDPVV